MMQSNNFNSTHGDSTYKTFYDHSSAQRVNTTVTISQSLRQQYPSLELTVVPSTNCNLFGYATTTGKASYHPIIDNKSTPEPVLQPLSLTSYMPAPQRIKPGNLSTELLLAKFLYKWNEDEYILYYVDGRDGTGYFPTVDMLYILTTQKFKAEALIKEIGKWTNDLHEEIWVYDQGFWQKSKELFDSIRNASWSNVILDAEMKKALIDDHTTFFRSKERYAKLQVPWKRGIIFYGPPGNGKTISLRAMMNLLYNLNDPIPTLYVRSLKSVSKTLLLLYAKEESKNQAKSCSRSFFLLFLSLSFSLQKVSRSRILGQRNLC